MAPHYSSCPAAGRGGPRRGTVPEQRTDFARGHAEVHLSGEIDSHSAPQMTDVLDMCLQSRPDCLTVDLSQVGFCDCSGLNALLLARQRAADQGIAMTVAGVSAPAVARVFALTGAGPILGIPATA
nr:STAS domain-containing protein [Streptomyces atroolivaceus]